MGGEINVESQVGIGSKFWFVIPVELVSATQFEPDHPSRRVTRLAAGQEPFRILIVDDSPDNLSLLQEMIESSGFEVQTANSGHTAVEMYRSWQPHLIWMDIRMPGIDGYQATKLIKENQGQAAKVIAVTASAFEEERARVLEAGCDDFIRKPFSETEIFNLMAKHLGVRYEYEELRSSAGLENARLTPDDLDNLPDGWIEELRQAATRGRGQELRTLFKEIEADRPQLASVLQELAENYEYKRILDITEQDEPADVE
jgi:CheY-like chemotaxis protein